MTIVVPGGGSGGGSVDTIESTDGSVPTILNPSGPTVNLTGGLTLPKGDLGGTLAAPNVVGLAGEPLLISGLSLGHGLRWNGSDWINDELGDILGVLSYAPTTADNKTGFSGDFGVIDATHLALTLTKPVPASGNVLIELTGVCAANAVGDSIYWAVSSAGSIIGPTGCVLAAANDTKRHSVSMTVLITGLTPGALPTFAWCAQATSASDVVLSCLNSQGSFTGTPSGVGCPATMIASAA